MGCNPEFLRSVPLFAELDDDELLAASKLFTERSYRRGQVVFVEEETGQFMYVVREGRVKVSRWLPSGKEVILAFHPAGDTFGEMSLIDGFSVPATVTAVVPSAILTMSGPRFHELLDNPRFNRALLRALSARCRDAWQQMGLLGYDNAEARIRMALYRLCQTRGASTEAGVRIELRLTHRELANVAGLTRETTTRVLSQLQREGALDSEGRLFVVADPDTLLESPALE